MSEAKVLRGFYGSQHISCDVFTYKGWYCVRGGTIANKTWEDNLHDDIDIEELPDFDCFTVNEGIHSLDELVQFVDEE